MLRHRSIVIVDGPDREMSLDWPGMKRTAGRMEDKASSHDSALAKGTPHVAGCSYGLYFYCPGGPAGGISQRFRGAGYA